MMGPQRVVSAFSSLRKPKLSPTRPSTKAQPLSLCRSTQVLNARALLPPAPNNPNTHIIPSKSSITHPQIKNHKHEHPQHFNLAREVPHRRTPSDGGSQPLDRHVSYRTADLTEYHPKVRPPTPRSIARSAPEPSRCVLGCAESTDCVKKKASVNSVKVSQRRDWKQRR